MKKLVLAITLAVAAAASLSTLRPSTDAGIRESMRMPDDPIPVCPPECGATR